MRRLIPSVCLLALLAGFTGCGGSKKVSVSGTVTRGGEKMTWPNGGILLVIFIPEDRQRDTNVYNATTDTATSTYKIDALPAGKYTVAVQQFDTKFMDALGGKYDPGHTELAYEVTQNGQVIDIDVPAPAKREPRGKKKDDAKEKEQEKDKD
jgi:hypothetical protein